jgi:hypothetical protein
MPPSLSSYQQAAASIYEPEKQAEAASLQTEKQGTINTLETGKGQVATDYQEAIDNLNSTVKENIGKINQLYTERLAGNFSGLQGNDVGGMFAKGVQQQSIIEQTRTNKLSSIAVEEANATNKYNTDIANLPSKYQSMENKYASDTYNSAVKDYNTNQYRQQQLDISRARLSQGNKQSQAEIKNNIAQQVSAKLTSVTGNRGGKSRGDNYVSPADYAKAKQAWVQAGYSAGEFDNQFSNFRNPNTKGYAVSQSPATYLMNEAY